MKEPKTQLEKLNSQIKNNKIIAFIIVFGTIVVAASTFTSAAKSLVDLVIVEGRPDINGEWKAEVTYDWPNAKYTETFAFSGDGEEVYGAASFLGAKRGIHDGVVKGDKIQFITKTQETLGDEPAKESVHHYRGKITADEIRFVMQTDGGYSEHVPIEFIAHRTSDSSAE